ncbi:protein mitoshell [Anopheles marshallii]|uniref:protein mitoshell n=1 Tax=Anopheles marshallii TaxID=1521116 RepID=UPI00237B13EA|nr:protein mitoshell [Anopheles marshallii]
MNSNFITSKNARSSNGQKQHQMQLYPVPPPVIPSHHAYPSMPLLMIRPPTPPPVWLYGCPRTYEQMQLNFSCSSGNAISFPNNHDSAVGRPPSVLSSFEFKMSSVINNNTCNMPVFETEPVSNEPSAPSECIETKSASGPEYLLEQFPELVKMALDGCKKAETLATCHQKRPCFKKIDSLCARLKQDLVKPDNVMSNINSQGIAWAVKDFIFVFTRIMNAWIIIKGYVPSKPEGLPMIQRELCPNFLVAFERWHETTHDLVQSLIKSFINLNKLAKQQRTGGNIFSKPEEQSSSPVDGAGAGQTKRDLLDDIAETESLNLNVGTYIRAGVYPNVTCPPPGFQQKPPPKEPTGSVSSTGSKGSALENDPSNISNSQTEECFPSPNGDMDHQFMGKFLRKTSMECMEWVLNEVRMIEEASYLYCINFAKNYFPDFDLIASDMVELRYVYKKHTAGHYSMVVELLDDLQQIVDTCKRYVDVSTQFELWNPSDPLPANSTDKQRKEWKNFPKLQNFIAKMEHLLSNIRKRSSAMSI